MSTSFSHGPVSKVAFRTPIAALYKTSTSENVIKVFFQDVLGGIRLISYDNAWNGGTSSFATAKLGSPLAGIGSPALDKASLSVHLPCAFMATVNQLGEVSLYFLSPENKLRELSYDRSKASGWVEGALSEKNIEVAPYSQLTAVLLSESEVRIFYQSPNDSIQVYSKSGSDWSAGANLGDALSGTSIAATNYTGTGKIRVFFQKTDLSITGIGTSGGNWSDMGLTFANQTARGALAIVSYIDPANSSDSSVRLYYTATDNLIKEKIYNAGSGAWADGTFSVKTIPGSNIDVITWINGNTVNFRAYLQQGQQVTALSEWAASGHDWVQGFLALPPATT